METLQPFTVFIILIITTLVYSDLLLPTLNCTNYQLVFEDVKEYECDLNGNLVLNESQPHFQPISDVSKENIIEVRFNMESGSNVRMHTLTNDICENFQNVTVLNFNNLGLEVVQENAFEKCVKLRDLVLGRNNLTHLPLKIFSQNIILNGLYISYNNFVQFDFHVIKNLSKLTLLNLEHNHLKELLLTEHSGLRELNLCFNDFEDFDVDGILMNFPSLRVLDLWNNNKIKELKIMEIKKTLKDKNVYYFDPNEDR